MDSMVYVMAKGHDVLTIGLPGNAVAKQGGCCLDSRGSKHYGLDTSTIMPRMTTKTCRVMCKDMMNMSDKGFGDLDSGLAGNANAMKSGAAARAAEQ